MIVHILTGGEIHLQDTHDMGRFKVTVEAPEKAYERLMATADASVVRFESSSVAWVSVAALCNWPGKVDTSGWGSSVEKMVEVARPYGWVSDDGKWIRAHIEWLQ